jgi:hypothetical protein
MMEITDFLDQNAPDSTTTTTTTTRSVATMKKPRVAKVILN